MKTLFIFIIGILVGLAIYWFVLQPKASHAPATVATASTNAESAAAETGQSWREKLNPEKIQEELNRTGKVIREKSAEAGAAIANATADASITASIKARLLKDSGLSAFKIDVDTNDGTVTLSGTVSSDQQIARAMEIALDTDGVHRVISTLQIQKT